jgi:hypothetical protein
LERLEYIEVRTICEIDGKNETHYQVLSITCNGFFDYFNVDETGKLDQILYSNCLDSINQIKKAAVMPRG